MQKKETKGNFNRVQRKNKKTLYILLAVIVGFGLVVSFLTCNSYNATEDKAATALDGCTTTEEVKTVWGKYKEELKEDEDFVLAVRNKLSSFNLAEKEVQECIKWLPPNPPSVNLIIVPDLSRRVIDAKNTPDQVSRDTFILYAAWKAFVDRIKFRQGTKDIFRIDVTDNDQAGGNFHKVADSLEFQLPGDKDKSNLLFFTADKNKWFKANITKLYALAKQSENATPEGAHLGADYIHYFKSLKASYSPPKLKKQTLFYNYINKLIIITDGYLEYKENPDEDVLTHATKVGRDDVSQLYNTNDIERTIDSSGLQIPKVDGVDLSNTEILVCEITGRKKDPREAGEILCAYWIDWLRRMGCKNEKIKVVTRQDYTVTNQMIQDFVNQ